MDPGYSSFGLAKRHRRYELTLGASPSAFGERIRDDNLVDGNAAGTI